jgi:VCBS repeat-containing protein
MPEGTTAPGDGDARMRPARGSSLTDPAWATGLDSIPIPPPDDVPVRFAQADAPARDLSIGRVEKMSGSATVLRGGVPVQLNTGDRVFKGDVVETSSGANVTIKFVDGTVLALSASARVVLDEMIYSAASTSNSVFLRLVEGVIGLVAGAAAKSGEFAVETPVAIMGIRGTAVRIEVLPNGATKFSLLREPNGSVGSLLLLDKNDRSRIIGSVTETGTATVVSMIGAAAATATRFAKTPEEMRQDGDFVRDMFMFVSDQLQRRGSSDTPDDLIIPVLEDTLPTVPELSPFTTVGIVPVPAGAIPELARLPREILTRGGATEDGPTVALGADALPPGVRTLPPRSLPPGVTFDEDTGRFRLDPSDNAYQHLGVGESQVVEVQYAILVGDVAVPAVVSWTVTGRNDDPVAKADRFLQVSEAGRTTLPVTRNDSDVDGDALHVVSWTDPLEGSVSLRSGELVFDPGRDFAALSEGQSATVSFTYTVSDGHGGTDTATAVVRMLGEGVFRSPRMEAEASGTLADTGQAVSLVLDAPARTTTTSAEVELTIDLGPLPQPTVNIVYVVDVSGSTDFAYSGAPVGDLNQDGISNTVLDAEIANLIDLTERIRGLGFSPADVTVTLIPFNQTADPATGVGSSGGAVVFGLGSTGDETIANALRSLENGGLTDFEQALQAAIGRLDGLDPQRSERNVVYFLSDGAGSGSFADEVNALRTDFGAEIAAAGIGGAAVTDMLAQIDSSGGVTILTTGDGLETSPVGLPNAPGEIVEVDMFVDGVEVQGVGTEDLVAVGSDFRLRFDIDDLSRFAGDRNRVTAEVTFDTGLILTASLDVRGALPRSTDLDL